MAQPKSPSETVNPLIAITDDAPFQRLVPAAPTPLGVNSGLRPSCYQEIRKAERELVGTALCHMTCEAE